TLFTYNFLSQMMQVSMTRGTITQIRSFNYNMTTLRLTSETHPESGTTSYTYNADGSLYQKNLANGKAELYSYDAKGRVTNVNNNNDPCGAMVFSYDNSSKNAVGRLWKTSYGAESCSLVPYLFNEELTYSSSGHVTQKQFYLQTSTTPWTSNPINANYTY